MSFDNFPTSNLPKKGWILTSIPITQKTPWFSAVLGFLVFGGLFLGCTFVLFGLPLFNGYPVDIGGLLVLSFGLAFFVPFLLQSIVLMARRKLSWYIWISLPPLVFALSFCVFGPLANTIGRQWAFKKLERKIEENPQLAGFPKDEKFRKGFVSTLQWLAVQQKPTLYIKLHEVENTGTPIEARNELNQWSFDRDVNPGNQTDNKWWIDRAEKEFPAKLLGYGEVIKQFENNIHKVIPKFLCEVKELSEKDDGKGKVVVDVVLQSRHLGKYQKYTFAEGFRSSRLVADFDVLWKVTLLDTNAKVLYEGEWTTRPSANITIKTSSDFYRPLHRSACHNFVREFFGRLGLEPDAEMTFIDYKGY